GVVAALLAGWPYLHLPAQERLAAAVLAARIDQRLEEKWQGVQPASQADDAEFRRRVYLDLTGRIPRGQEVRDFLEDKSSDRRYRVVAELLDSPGFVRHFSNTWWNLFIASANQQAAPQAASFKAWLQQQLRSGTPYDKMVWEMLTASGRPGANPAR